MHTLLATSLPPPHTPNTPFSSHPFCISMILWTHRVCRMEASLLIFLILLLTKPNIEVNGWLYQTKTNITHIVYQPFSRVMPPNKIASFPSVVFSQPFNSQKSRKFPSPTLSSPQQSCRKMVSRELLEKLSSRSLGLPSKRILPPLKKATKSALAASSM